MGICFAGVPSYVTLPLMLPLLVFPKEVTVEAARMATAAAELALVRMTLFLLNFATSERMLTRNPRLTPRGSQRVDRVEHAEAPNGGRFARPRNVSIRQRRIRCGAAAILVEGFGAIR